VVTSTVRWGGGTGSVCRPGTGPGPAIIAGRAGSHRRPEATRRGAGCQPAVVRPVAAGVVARTGARVGARARVGAGVVVRRVRGLVLPLALAVLVVEAATTAVGAL